MKRLRYITTTTPDGDFHIIIDDQDVALASGFGKLEHLIQRLPVSSEGYAFSGAKGHDYERAVQKYFQGDSEALSSIKHHQDGSVFKKTVWSSISKIPYGQTVSYRALAETYGSAGAVRALGSACGSNRLILIIPCHRVVRSDGGLGEYYYGPDIKQSLLKREGAI